MPDSTSSPQSPQPTRQGQKESRQAGGGPGSFGERIVLTGSENGRKAIFEIEEERIWIEVPEGRMGLFLKASARGALREAEGRFWVPGAWLARHMPSMATPVGNLKRRAREELG